MFIQAILFALVVTLFGNYINPPQWISWLGIFPYIRGYHRFNTGRCSDWLDRWRICSVSLFGLEFRRRRITLKYVYCGLLCSCTNNSGRQDPTLAPSLAVPVGLLGVFLHQAQMTINAYLCIVVIKL